MTSPRPRYDHTRDMADAGSYRATIVWLCLLMGSTGIALTAISMMMANHSLYVHPELPHPAMLPIHWR
jgi:hypothetical protein